MGDSFKVGDCQRCARLRREREYLNQEIAGYLDRLQAADEKVAALEAEVDDLEAEVDDLRQRAEYYQNERNEFRAAVEWYADRNHWDREHSKGLALTLGVRWLGGDCDDIGDGWERAAYALKQAEAILVDEPTPKSDD